MKQAQIKSSRPVRIRQAGQTLIIAVIILGILLILGVAFATIINRNINETQESGQRTRAGDAARAGAEYAHSQMLNSPLGADWRPEPTAMAIVGGLTKDPDALYLRPGSGFAVEPDPVNRPGYTVQDLGGPDYLGPYTRVEFERSRALVRVRYQPADYDAVVSPTGQLRSPGLVKNAIAIDSVGREGTVSANDPTGQLKVAVQVTGYASGAAVRAGLGQIKDADNSVRNTKKLLAFANLPTQFGRFVQNIDKVSRPAEFGVPAQVGGGPLTWKDVTNVGVSYEGLDVSVPNENGQAVAGTALRNLRPWNNMPGGGSVWVNGRMRLSGQNDFSLNRHFGESVVATDGIEPGNNGSVLNLSLYDYIPNANPNLDGWGLDTAVSLAAGQFDSGNPGFSTFEGALRDGTNGVDTDLTIGARTFIGGSQREVGRIEPMLITRTDPANGLNRYRELTQNSGNNGPAGINLGKLGYGPGVFIDASEKGNRASDSARQNLDPSKSMPSDWLNPNNPNSQGWQGPFYVPVASYLTLRADGFTVTRDSRSKNRFFTDPTTGAVSTRSAMNYYVKRFLVGGVFVPFIAHDYAVQAGFNPSSNVLADWQNFGQVFNGVVMFEGDVRVKGVIPSGVQMSVVSMGNIYVEGSITKGTVDATSGVPATYTNPSSSMCALMARDYVVINTTQFFGPAPGSVPHAKSGDPLPDTPNPIEFDATNPELEIMTQFLMDRNGLDPSAWTPLATQYTMPGGLGTTTSQDLPVNVMMQVSADDNGPSYLSVDTLTGTAFDAAPDAGGIIFLTQKFLGLPAATPEPFNAAAPFFASTEIPVYGLGNPSVNSYPKFETIAQPVVYPVGTPNHTSTYNPGTRQITNVFTTTGAANVLSVEDPTYMKLFLNPVGTAPAKNWLLARVAMAPFDVRIEATLYAERGSFFVIPGPWFNSNPDDNRQAFEQNYTPGNPADDLNTARLDYGAGANLLTAQQRRMQTYGNSPEVPFANEPIDVKVTIVGSIVENMPAPMSQQSEWMKKWGWIPRRLGGTGLTIPNQHVGATYDLNTNLVVPNFQVVYDPSLATGSVPAGGNLVPIRTDLNGRMLPPLPRLPVSPKLAYFGEVTS